MADTHFEPQSHPYPQSMPLPTDSTIPSAKRRKIIGQCPTCHQTFTSRHSLRAHMSDPQTHSPASDSDAISFGELSSDLDSGDDELHARKSPPQHPVETSPTLDNDGFVFSDPSAPTLDQDGFEFLNDPSFFPSAQSADTGSAHTMPDSDAAPSADAPPSYHAPAAPREKGALGVLYCGTCERYFGNETVFKRHFMFGRRHGEEPRDMRDLYYRVWGKSWADEARGREGNWSGRVEGEGMEF